MSSTILDTLQEAEMYLSHPYNFGPNKNLGIFKLKSAITLLKKGYSPFDEITPLLEKYGDFENVPEKHQLNHL